MRIRLFSTYRILMLLFLIVLCNVPTASAAMIFPDIRPSILPAGGLDFLQVPVHKNTTQADMESGINSFTVIEEKLEPSEAAALESLIQNTLHSFAYDDATGAWYARNAANRIMFTYTRDGMAEFSEGPNTFGLTLLGIGQDGAISPAGAGIIRADGRLLNITRPGFTEWYRNNDDGIEQGMTIPSRPPGNGMLQVRFGLAGNKSLSLKDKTTLIITNASGTPLFEYTGLHALSSDDKNLPATLATDGRTLLWIIDDTNAVYPVTIDPVVVSASKGNATFTGGGGNSIFGYSVALSSDGNTALVGAYGNSTAATNAGAAYIFVAPGGVWSGTTKAYAANATFTGGAANDYVGQSVALSSDGSTALIGAYRNSTNGKSLNGAAYLFTKPGTGWSGTIPLSAALPNFTGVSSNDNLGYSSSLALSSNGSTALIGAWKNGTSGWSNNGAAYLFRKPGGGWPATTTSASAADATFLGGKASDNFGFSVALSSDGNTALVGAWNNASGDMSTNGAAYIFVAPGGVWSGTTSASAANATFTGGANSDQFGSAVALSSDGSTVLVGAWKNSTSFYQAGAAYLFTKPGTGWSGTTSASTANATFTGGAMQDYFGNGYGNSVALSSDGSTALVGAYHNSSIGNTWAGAAYLFKKPNVTGWNGTTSASAATEKFQGVTGSNYFGYSVALNSTGTMALIGAYGNYTGGSQTGSAYIFGPPPYVTLTAGGTTTGTTGTVVNGLTLNPTDTITNIDLFLGTDAATTSGTAIKTGISSLSGSTATTVNSVDLTGKTAGTYYLIVNSTGTTTILGATSSAVYTVTGGTTTPVAGFSSANVSLVTNSTAQGWAGVSPITMQLTDTSANTPTSWKWARNNLTNTVWTVFNTSQNARDSFWIGNWSVNLTATNSAGSNVSSQTLWVNVSAAAAAPTVTSITPSTGQNTTTVSITNLAGTGFSGTPTVNLTRAGYSNITATGVTLVSASQLSCSFDLTNRMSGTWNVNVTNPDGQQAALLNGFEITNSSTPTPTPTPNPTPTSSDSGNTGNIQRQSTSSSSGVSVANGAPAGQTVTYSFGTPAPDYPVSIESISFTPDQSIGQSQCLVTQMSPAAAFSIPDRPAVYESIQINWINPNVMSEATIQFSVKGYWLREHNVGPQDIVMMHQHDLVWTEIPTVFDHVANDIYYYRSTTPTFSNFAVSVRKNVTVVMVSNVTTIPAQTPAMINTAAATITPQSTPSTTPAQKASPTPTPVPAPASEPATGTPVLYIIAGIVIVILAVAGFFIGRRWWWARQNPNLFRKDD
ncbi:MAG: PGF-pre-PGF domain-containing protein [Methanoregula sp.]